MISGVRSKHSTPVNHFPKIVGSPITTSGSCIKFSAVMNMRVDNIYWAKDPIYPYKLQDLVSQNVKQTGVQSVVYHGFHLSHFYVWEEMTMKCQ